MKENLVIGFGSEILSDQGIIPKLLQDLRDNFAGHVDFQNELINHLDLINSFEGYRNLLIIDITQDKTQEIGALHYYSPENHQPGLHLDNYHDSSVVETIQTARKLGFSVPVKIGIVIINVKEVYTLNTQCTKELSDRYPELLVQLKALISHFFSTREKVLIVE